MENKDASLTNIQSRLKNIFMVVLRPIFGMVNFVWTFLSPESGEDQTKKELQNRRTRGIKKYRGSNIHTLADLKEDDEDKHTWNGNSTQQL